MFTSLKALRQNHRRGMTLVELMIVVAILGILASVAGVAFFRNVKRAKIAKLESIANKAALGQNDALRGQYFPPANGNTATLVYTGGSLSGAQKKQLSTFLKMSEADLEPGHVLRISTGAPNVGCNNPCCTDVGFTPPATRWYVTCAEQDLDNNPGTPPSRAVKLSTQNNIIIVNEGQ